MANKSYIIYDGPSQIDGKPIVVTANQKKLAMGIYAVTCYIYDNTERVTAEDSLEKIIAQLTNCAVRAEKLEENSALAKSLQNLVKKHSK